MLCIWWDEVGFIYYELLKPNETITGERYRTKLMRLTRALREKRPQYEQRYEKVILQHNNAQPHAAKPVKTYLETLKWEILPHPPYSPNVAPSNYYLFQSMETDQGALEQSTGRVLRLRIEGPCTEGYCCIRIQN